MDCRNIVIYLSQLNNYPVRLAQKIGLERATLWYELFKRYGEITFQFVESIPINLGITEARKCFDSLYSLGYLIKNEDGSYGIDFDKIFDVTDGASLNAGIKPPFTDTRFITLLNDYIRFLKEKGRKVDVRSLYKQFDGKTLENSIEALRLALNNRWVTLFFNEKRERPSPTAYGGSKSGRGTTSGGGANENRTGNFSTDEI